MLIIENICSAWKHSKRVRQPYMEVHCYPILMILINIPLPTLKTKSSHQNQVQYLLSTSCVPTWQRPSTATCITLESLSQLSLSLLPQCKHSAGGELFYAGCELLAQKSIQARLLTAGARLATVCASLFSRSITGTGATHSPATTLQPDAGLGPLKEDLQISNTKNSPKKLKYSQALILPSHCSH